ncbi:hypothetical protein BO71DRAFT_447345 [Aspergillus ellipticus CBS 707.79]|uniref:Protein kinase domain-containing protein n=1 Tax=Aspergillus ellipticus CBS 707.79 TaxID=1448320 RepID=A0A319DNT1_9EURO|nr:hypothetical protein BO71DRAFT_447345 [Aspergillus ellipticus CBS 707.79]
MTSIINGPCSTWQAAKFGCKPQNDLFGLLNECHRRLSQAIRIETNASLTTQGEATNIVNRRFPSQICAWQAFPRLQEETWDYLLRDDTFSSLRQFSTRSQLDYVQRNIQSIYSEASLRTFHRDTVDNFVGEILQAITQSEYQFCVQVAADERRIPVYAVEFKAPHKVTLPELTAGLHDMEPERDVIGREGDTFEFYSKHGTQIYSYMLDVGVRRGFLCTGEAYVFLDIPADDPSILQYHLCVPNQDVSIDGEGDLRRTAVGQIEYMDVLRDIPESLRKDPPASNYRSSSWKAVKRSPYLTRSRAGCRPSETMPEHTSEEHSSSEDGLGSPSPMPTPVPRAQRSTRSIAPYPSSASTRSDRQYCTTKCIFGLSVRGPLDKHCPNVHEHGTGRHSFGSRELMRRLRDQLRDDRTAGLKTLHIRGRIGFMIQATLLSHGYTMIIEATTEDRCHRLRQEAKTYQHLRPLQGLCIPVYLGYLRPPHPYWYHGEPMTEMLIFSWAGIRIQQARVGQDELFIDRERKKLVDALRAHGIQHNNVAWRNLLWNSDLGSVFIIDFESISALPSQSISERQPLSVASGNYRAACVTWSPSAKPQGMIA